MQTPAPCGGLKKSPSQPNSPRKTPLPGSGIAPACFVPVKAQIMSTTFSDDVRQKLNFIFGRRSIRVYRPGPIPDEWVRILLEAAMAAPSAAAKDPWRFVVIRRPSTLHAVAEALPHGGFLREAVLGIVVCGDLEAAHDRQLSYLLQDCAAATENLLLAAHILGLGACWLGIHPREDRIRRISALLELPGTVLPVAAVAVGWPGEDKPPRTRFEAAYVHFEKW